MPERVVHNLIVCLVIGAALVGCSQGVQVTKVRSDILFHRRGGNAITAGTASARTLQFLRRYDLEDKFARDEVGVLRVLGRQARKQPDPDLVFTLAELSYLTGRKTELRNRPLAMNLYLSAVVYSYFYLFDPVVDAPNSQFDPRFRLACELYNHSLAQCIRLAQKQDLRLDESLHLEFAGGNLDISITRHGFPWKADDFGYFKFADDYDVKGLTNQYHTYGLGVPLIAVRDHRSPGSPQDKYFADRQSFAVTAFLRMNCSICDDHESAVQGHGPSFGSAATLELYDPLRIQNIDVAGQPVPLESDLTVPLGYFLSRAKLEKLELTGLLRPGKVLDKAGLYMVRPYEKGKIPVVLVHGLWSSPLAWMQMFNDLQGDPALRDHYQFWFFMYPTGGPIVGSASLLRESLNEAMTTFDPQGEDPSLRQMVLVGHSMGGLLSKMMAQNSDQALWDLVSTKPIDQIEADPEERDRIRQVFFYDAQPYVRRLVFIATPHQGSSLSQRPIGRLGSALISLPRAFLDMQKKLVANNPDAFKPFFSDGLPTSVDNLSPDSPIIQTIAMQPIGPTVTYHSIIGEVSDNLETPCTDGVVPYTSAHLEGAVSEYVVQSGHSYCQSHPLSVLEVRRILLEHLQTTPIDPTLQRAHFEEPTRPSEPGTK